MVLDQNGKQLSPCIVAKVRHALGLTNKRPTNNKRCHPDYWERTCGEIGKGQPQEEIQRVIDLYLEYMN
ncbi:hypothetical protein A3860_33865 [Niastella vici]|uniref:Uncharacterized protein n=1 Tax=Niastella vici TaxID=1703345 RepID=A0A1V9FPS7_9BACT|nr:hypothetical protein [Niastella vici]OQP60369.1 hypothetical protein A3860_33865 [Niastella vici]